MDSDQFKTLLAAASFMGPDEARVESNTGRVRYRYRIELIERIFPFVHIADPHSFAILSNMLPAGRRSGCGIKN
jgi:hypothetical protein